MNVYYPQLSIIVHFDRGVTLRYRDLMLNSRILSVLVKGSYSLLHYLTEYSVTDFHVRKNCQERQGKFFFK